MEITIDSLILIAAMIAWMCVVYAVEAWRITNDRYLRLPEFVRRYQWRRQWRRVSVRVDEDTRAAVRTLAQLGITAQEAAEAFQRFARAWNQREEKGKMR